MKSLNLAIDRLDPEMSRQEIVELRELLIRRKGYIDVH